MFSYFEPNIHCKTPLFCFVCFCFCFLFCFVLFCLFVVCLFVCFCLSNFGQESVFPKLKFVFLASIFVNETFLDFYFCWFMGIQGVYKLVREST